mmetsp:Transcript_4980/g.16320  ORF Transcript_4980/g.16320 Transcript_4980/m.16320 type:complete len:213 (-) Transcript_4980:1536-2174(-)
MDSAPPQVRRRPLEPLLGGAPSGDHRRAVRRPHGPHLRGRRVHPRERRHHLPLERRRERPRGERRDQGNHQAPPPAPELRPARVQKARHGTHARLAPPVQGTAGSLRRGRRPRRRTPQHFVFVVVVQPREAGPAPPLLAEPERHQPRRPPGTRGPRTQPTLQRRPPPEDRLPAPPPRRPQRRPTRRLFLRRPRLVHPPEEDLVVSLARNEGA